jgi:hypothetical protein
MSLVTGLICGNRPKERERERERERGSFAKIDLQWMKQVTRQHEQLISVVGNRANRDWPFKIGHTEVGP